MQRIGAKKHLVIPSVSNCFNGFALFNLAPVIPVVTGMLNISIFEAGLLVSASMFGVAAGLLPGGMLSDRFGVKRALTFALLSALPSLLLIAAAADFLIVLILRFTLGLSCGFIFAGSANYTFAWSEESKVARNQGVFGGAFGFGIAATYVLSLLALDAGWVALSLTPLPALLFPIFALKIWGEEYVVGKSRFSFREVGGVVANRGIILLGLSQFVLGGLFVVMATWITSYLVAREQPLVESIILGAVIMSMIGFSRMSGGFAAGVLKEKNLISLSLLVCAVAVVGLTFTPIIALAFTLAMLIIWFSQLTFGPVNRLTVMTSGYLSGTSLGMVLFIMVLGTAVLPAAYGYILDSMRSFEAGFWFLAFISGAVLSAFYMMFRVPAR